MLFRNNQLNSICNRKYFSLNENSKKYLKNPLHFLPPKFLSLNDEVGSLVGLFRLFLILTCGLSLCTNPPTPPLSNKSGFLPAAVSEGFIFVSFGHSYTDTFILKPKVMIIIRQYNYLSVPNLYHIQTICLPEFHN